MGSVLEAQKIYHLKALAVAKQFLSLDDGDSSMAGPILIKKEMERL